MKKSSNIYCLGVCCPIKTTCLRFTNGVKLLVDDGTKDKFIRKCTNQKLFIQDSNNVKSDSNKR